MRRLLALWARAFAAPPRAQSPVTMGGHVYFPYLVYGHDGRTWISANGATWVSL